MLKLLIILFFILNCLMGAPYGQVILLLDKKISNHPSKAIQIVFPVQHAGNINLQFKIVRIFDLSKTRDFQITTFCFKYFNILLPSEFQNMFTINQDLYSYYDFIQRPYSCDIIQEAPLTQKSFFFN